MAHLESSGPPLPTLEDLAERARAHRATLPLVWYRRKSRRVEVAFVSRVGDAETVFGRPAGTYDPALVRAGYREFAAITTALVGKRLKRTDDFDLAAFTAFLERRVAELDAASDSDLLAELEPPALVRTLFNALRARARSLALPARECGAVSFIQRFGSALQLNVHFHVLVPEGVFADDGAVHPLPPPEEADVESLLETFLRRLVPLLERYGLHELEAIPEHALDALQLSSAQWKLPLGSPHPPRRSRRCATLDGFSLHANTRVHENDRTGLETLCRYGARGPLSLERLSLREDGYRLSTSSSQLPSHPPTTPLSSPNRDCLPYRRSTWICEASRWQPPRSSSCAIRGWGVASGYLQATTMCWRTTSTRSQRRSRKHSTRRWRKPPTTKRSAIALRSCIVSSRSAGCCMC